MLAGRETSHFFDKFLGPVSIRNPNPSGCKHIRHCVKAGNFVVSLGGTELLHGNTHGTKLKYQGATRCLGFDNDAVGIQVHGLPLAIHARQADEDIADILAEERERGGAFPFLLHCFSSGRGLAERAVEMGGYLSFSGILTFPKSEELREIARDIPADRLLVETDAPYLAPVPFRGKRCEPAMVAHTAKVLAGVRGLEIAALEALTTRNFETLFQKAR